jgi:hypothetical protein
MCLGKICYTYRVYETLDVVVRRYWPDEDLDGGLPSPLSETKNIDQSSNEYEMKTKFHDGLQEHWRDPRRYGEGCDEDGCHCVKTDEKIGGRGSQSGLFWRQPMETTLGKFTVEGRYTKTFQDYVGKCDESKEIGEPIGLKLPGADY